MNNYNTDGYYERRNFIDNSNDMNKLAQNGPSNFDNSFAKMRTEERRNQVVTANSDNILVNNDGKTVSDADEFLIRKTQIDNLNRTMHNNMFKKPE